MHRNSCPTGLLHHTVCFTTLRNTRLVLERYILLLQRWQQQRAPHGRVLWRTAEAFGDFKEHVFQLSDGSSMVMRGRRVTGIRFRRVKL